MSKDSTKLLKGLGLNPDAPNLVPDMPAKAVTADHTIPAENIVFQPEWLDGFADLEDSGVRNDASRFLFDRFKSVGRDKPRNSLLHRRISTFINEVRMSRKTGGHVKERVKASAEQRDLAQVIASLGLTAEELVELARGRKV